MTAQTQAILEKFRAQDRARMLAGLEQPRQEPFVLDNGDLDLGNLHIARAAYERRVQQIFH
jgi:hypothetical protein